MKRWGWILVVAIAGCSSGGGPGEPADLTIGESGNEAFGDYSTSGGSNGDVRIKRLGGGRYRIRLFQAQPCSANFVGTFELVTPDAMDGQFTGSSPCNRGTIFDFDAAR